MQLHYCSLLKDISLSQVIHAFSFPFTVIGSSFWTQFQFLLTGKIVSIRNVAVSEKELLKDSVNYD